MAKRENGGGTIRTVKGANGTKYYAYAPARYAEVDGVRKCIREPLGSFRKKSDARAAIERFREAPSLKYNYTLTMVYEEWSAMAYDDISKQTVDNYKAAWKNICAAIGPMADVPVRELTSGDIRSVYDYWLQEHEVLRQGRGKPFKAKAGPLSKSSMQKIKALLTQLYDFCMANEIVRQNLASLVKVPRDAQEGEKRAFTDLEFAKLEKLYRDIPGGEACYVLCYTGFRVSEFCQLTRFSYDPKEKTLRSGLKTEAGYDRVVPVHPKIQPIIDKWYASCNGPLYPKENGKPYDKDSFRKKVWEPCMAALGMPDDLTPHSARHTFGTKLSKAKVSTEDIQKLIGHADYSTTANVYINQDISTFRKAVNSME